MVQQLVASKGEQDQPMPCLPDLLRQRPANNVQKVLNDQLPAHLHARIRHPLTVLRSFGVSRMPEQETLPEVEVQIYRVL